MSVRANRCEVLADEHRTRYLCHLRGRLRLAPSDQTGGPAVMAGDWVAFEPLSHGTGVVREVEPRRTQLVRPPVANADLAVVVAALADPPISWPLVDRMLVVAAASGLEPLVCLNKIDLVDDGAREAATLRMRRNGYPVVATSARTCAGVDGLVRLLGGRTAVVAGPSGAGKSSLLNCLTGGGLRTGEVSLRTRRGRHTTRHVELLEVPGGGLVADTPGFARLDLDWWVLEQGFEANQLAGCFPEFTRFESACRFAGCLHRSEPGCAVKAAIAAGEIDPSRHASYLQLLEEVEHLERHRYR